MFVYEIADLGRVNERFLEVDPSIEEAEAIGLLLYFDQIIEDANRQLVVKQVSFAT
jgi:hypothetical protein